MSALTVRVSEPLSPSDTLLLNVPFPVVVRSLAKLPFTNQPVDQRLLELPMLYVLLLSGLKLEFTSPPK